MSDKRLVIKRVIMCSMTAFMVGFIFINSALPADVSSQESGSITELINSLLSRVGIGLALSEHLVRKFAHFIEYFVLGTLLFYTVRSFNLRRTKSVFVVPLIGFLVASVDETIQLFSFGRSAQVSDVLLDFIGVFSAVILFSITSYLLTKKDKDVSN